ncbi:hypothetical protein [Candidatus Spongiihabitans sp.]|uniref:hypothetical protein n=1 Tax=Candidatus Spongiihabitans sp. TaxID=3101308 RepID=UPI003C7A182E
MDARKGRGATVRVEFKVAKNNRGETFLTFKDSNTTGLTGAVIHDVSDYKNLKKSDHWARFEAFAYTKEDPDALGARGQGKFIFLRASKQYRMIYDTLRDDGVYRLGATEATKVGRKIYPQRGKKWEDETAKNQLRSFCDLEPLEDVGARIIVCEPIQEVLDEIKNGAFERAIQETWFRAIEKNQIEVWLNVSGESKKIDLPSPYPLPKNDVSKIKTWIYKKDFDDSTIFSSDGGFKIKNFCVVYLPKHQISEDLQGIAIVQNGMKVTSLNIDMAPTDVREKITGYIEFERELDRELRRGKNQNPNHYDLKWRSTTPRAIKGFINRQLEEFGRQKLGIGEDKREKQKRHRNNAEQKAMDLLLRYASDIDLRGPRRTGPVPDPGPCPNPNPPPNKEIGLIVQTQFPDIEKKPRVDWGEEMLVYIRCFNKTADDVKGLVSARILQADTLIEELLANEPVELRQASESNLKYVVVLNDGSPLAIGIDQPRYKNPGEYRIRTVLINADDGDEIDARTVKFWVEENPPRRMPFKLEAAALSTKHAWQPGGDNNDPTIYYNTNHPHYKASQQDEEDQADYLFNICLEGAFYFILTRPYNEHGEVDYRPLNTDNIVHSSKDVMPEKVYQEISEYISSVRWRRFEE